MTALLPCPFCGRLPLIDSGLARRDPNGLGSSHVGFAFIKCTGCGVTKGEIGDAPDEAAAIAAVSTDWNRRAPLA